MIRLVFTMENIMNKLLIDGNSVGHFANNGSKLTLGEMPIQAVYGSLRTLRTNMALFQHYDPVVLWDGMSWRKEVFDQYKSNRDKRETAAEKLQALRNDDYKRQVPLIKKGLQLLGIPQVSAANMEADDLAGMLTDKYAATGKVALLTGDKDWIQLVQQNVMWRDFIRARTINPKNFEETTGVDTTEKFVQVKGLCGDAGDGIPGVGGVGEKGAIQFVNEFGSFEEFLNLATFDKSFDLSKQPKKYRDLVEDEGKAITFAQNIKLMDLRTPHRPAAINMRVDKGSPNKELFRTFCDRLLFNSITQELDEWIRVFPAFRE